MNAINAVKNSTFAAWLRGKHELTGRQVLVGAAAAAGFLVLTAGTATGASYNTVTVSIDGATRQVSGFERSVGQLLVANGIQLDARDTVEPARNANVRQGMEIAVSRVESVAVVRDGEITQQWLPRAEAASAREGVKVASAAISRAEAVLSGDSTEVDEIAVVHDGKTVAVLDDNIAGKSAAELAAAAGIELTPLDRVQVSEDSAAVTLTVQRVARTAEIEEQTVAHEVQTVENAQLPAGTTKLKTPGRDGKKRVSTFVEKIDGEVVHSSEPVLQEIEKPVTEVVEVGTGAAHNTQSRHSNDDNAGENNAPASGDVFARLAKCESGGNPSTNTGNGYYGMYQFTQQTWERVGGVGLPSNASAAEQTQRARILQQRSGWGQWPACAASLGLY